MRRLFLSSSSDVVSYLSKDWMLLLLLEVVEDDVDEDDRRLLGHWEEEESIREEKCEEEEKEAVSEISRNDADADVDDEKRVSGRGILA